MNEQLARITKEAEEKYPVKMQQNLKLSIMNQSLRMAHIESATAEAERAEKLRECLMEIDTELASMEDYLHGNEGDKVSAIRNKINSALNNDL